jgi:predicted regulator of Ras-like GTPase activity (Roadblock/LC7/MglB family)
LLRGLLRHLDDNDAVVSETPRFVTYASAPVTSAPPPQMPVAAPLPTLAVSGNELQLPLQAIIATMPMDLRAKVMQTPPAGMVVSFPLEKVLTQLARGAVKITFGELRQAAPGVFVNSGGEHDHKPVMLPLNEILSRLNPALLARRVVQKQVELTDEIGSPFGACGQGITISTPAAKSPATPPAPPLRMVTPPIQMPPPPSRMATMAASSFPSVRPTPLGFHNSTHATRVATLQNNGNGGNGNGAPKTVAPVAPQAPMEPADILAPLAAFSEEWPEGLRLEIARLNLSGAQVLLPANLIEPAMKRGRVTFTWQNLRSLIKPTPPPASIHDGIELELPLKVIAPLFLTRQKAAHRAQPAALPPTDIPNLFFGFPQPQAEAPEPEAPKKVSETEIRCLAPKPVVPKPVDAKPADSNYYIWGESKDAPQVDETEYRRPQRPATDFTSRYATPQEIVTHAMALPGVVGALVALPDGLKVASQVPSDLNADTLAAFLPQIFDRVSQSTKELRMGALNNFNFTVGNVPWKIFRVNAVYFAAFGCAGEPLPATQLAALAAELDRKNQ